MSNNSNPPNTPFDVNEFGSSSFSSGTLIGTGSNDQKQEWDSGGVGGRILNELRAPESCALRVLNVGNSSISGNGSSIANDGNSENSRVAENYNDERFSEVSQSCKDGLLTVEPEAKYLEPVPLCITQLTAEQEKNEVERALKELGQNFIGVFCFFIPQEWWDMWTAYTHFSDPVLGRVKSEFFKGIDISTIDNWERPGPIDMESITMDDDWDNQAIMCKLKSGSSEVSTMQVPLTVWNLLASWYGVIGKPFYGRYLRTPSTTSPNAFDRRIRIAVLRSGGSELHLTVWKQQTIAQLKNFIGLRLHMDPNDLRVYAPQTFLLGDDVLLKDHARLDKSQLFLVERKNGVWGGVPSSSSRSGLTVPSRPTTDLFTKTALDDYPVFKIADMKAPGICGLTNLGNTCYMNSALQCLSHTVAFRDYLLSDLWKNEVNKENSLGSKGELTSAFADVVRGIWQGKPSYFSPTAFKAKICERASQFSGYSQHDAQELLMFLLDGIHEDLNRGKIKSSRTCPEYNGQSDEVWAAESWNRYKQTNDSVIVDWFQGQIKQRLVCPDCGNSHVLFEPFGCLSLPLPQKNTIKIAFMLHTQDTNKEHFSVVLNLPKEFHVRELCKIVQDLPCLADVNPNVSWNNLCVRSFSFSGYQMEDYKVGFSLSSLDLRNLHLFALSGIKDARDVFVTVVKQNSAIGQPFLLPLIDGMTYTQLRLALLKRLASGIDRDALKKYIESKGLENSCSEPIEKEVVPGFSNSCLISLFDTLFFVQNVNSSGRYEGRILRKVDNEPAFTTNDFCWTTNLKVSLTTEGIYSGVFKDGVVRNNIIRYESSEKDDDYSGELTLDKCLDRFTSLENLDDWRCSKCHVSCKPSKQTEFWRLPPILIVHLKRFESRDSGERVKLDTFVDFPINNLDMTKRVLSHQSDEPLVYDLYAVCSHMGSINAGHYIADALVGTDWYRFSDSTVMKIESSASIQANAYVLFYRLRGWTPVSHSSLACSTLRPLIDDGLSTTGLSSAPEAISESMPTNQKRTESSSPQTTTMTVPGSSSSLQSEPHSKAMASDSTLPSLSSFKRLPDSPSLTEQPPFKRKDNTIV